MCLHPRQFATKRDMNNAVAQIIHEHQCLASSCLKHQFGLHQILTKSQQIVVWIEQ
jgi:hypothetical protein